MNTPPSIEHCYGIDCLKCESACQHREIGISVIREKQREVSLRYGKRDEFVGDAEFLDEMGVVSEGLLDFDQHEPSVRELIQEAQLELLRRLIFLWLEKPMTFDATMARIVKGENQSDMARAKGVTRQYISKAIKAENNNALREEIRKLHTVIGFSSREQKAYRLFFEDGVTVRAAAKIMGISPATAYRMKQHLRSKLTKSETKNLVKKGKK